MITAFVLSACLLSQTTAIPLASKAGMKAIGDAPESPLSPDKHGLMEWQWVEPPHPGGKFNRVEHARAKFISVDKHNVVTIKTDRGRTVKIPRDKIGRKQEEWLAKELAERAEKKK